MSEATGRGGRGRGKGRRGGGRRTAAVVNTPAEEPAAEPKRAVDEVRSILDCLPNASSSPGRPMARQQSLWCNALWETADVGA